MKNRFYLFATAVLCIFVLTACQGEPATSKDDVEPTPDVSDPMPEVESVDITLYLPNEMADGFDATVQTMPLEAALILDALVEGNSLPEGTKLLQFSAEDEKIIMDLSQEFGDEISSTGSTGEFMLMGSLVNTFLDAFDCESAEITCEGEVISTGHTVYDRPITFFEPTQ